MAITKKPLSQYDGMETLRSAHQDENQAFRVTSANTSVPPEYSRVDLTYNVQGSVTNALFYAGSLAEEREITFVGDSGGSLNNGYFTLYSEYNESGYYVWYNVDGLGVDPAIPGLIGLEVPITENDPASIVRYATELILKNNEDFTTSKLFENKLKIVNKRFGVSNNTIESGTGFSIVTTQQGSETLIKSIDIAFDGNARYLFNEQEKQFVVESALPIEVEVDVGDNIAISRHSTTFSEVDSNSYTNAQLSTSSYTEIYSYTATTDIRIRTFKIKADTFGAFRLKIDGTIVDYFLTSQFLRNAHFYFIEEIDLLNGQELTIEFLPERIYLPNYEFFYRLEGYEP